MQRSFIQLLKGNLADSVTQYPPLLFVMGLSAMIVIRLFNKNIINKNLFSLYAWMVLAVVMLNYFIKMALHVFSA